MKYSNIEIDEFFKIMLPLKEYGVSNRACAGYVGISHSTLADWLKRGESKRSKFYKYKQAWIEAEGKAEVYHQTEVHKKCITMDDHLKILKVLNPERYVMEKRVRALLDMRNEDKLSINEALEKFKANFADFKSEWEDAQENNNEEE